MGALKTFSGFSGRVGLSLVSWEGGVTPHFWQQPIMSLIHASKRSAFDHSVKME